jgi:hypothetical protein
MTDAADRRARLASRFQPEPTAKGPRPPATPPAEPVRPYVRRTYYLPEDLADWLDSEQRRLNYELEGGLAKSRLLKAILEDARPRLDAIVEGLRRQSH